MAGTRPDPRGRLDPRVARLFALLRASRGERLLAPAPLRASFEALAPLLAAGAPAVASERQIRIPGPGGPLRARVFEPGAPGSAPPRAVVVYLHGGGWVAMSPETHAGLARRLCHASGCVLLSLDYRLAPEHPYPAALDDCVATLRWLRVHAAELGASGDRIAMAGDSAGANLALATALRARAAGEAPPEALALLCPLLDVALDTDSFRRFGPDDPVLDAELMRFFRDSYVRPDQWADPCVSPLRAELAGLPPCCVVEAELDPLRDDALELAQRLEQAGVPLELHRYPGMPHIFFVFPGLGADERCIAALAAFLRTQLGPQAAE